MTGDAWPEKDLREVPTICHCCDGRGILWVIGGPVVCPHCGGCGEDVRIPAPLAINLAELH